MRPLIGLLIILSLVLSAGLLFAEDQVQKTNPPSQAEQHAAAQPAPAAAASEPKTDTGDTA